jgi:hypothetical protein
MEGSRLNLHGISFIAGLGSWLIGKPTDIKLRGTSREMRAVTEAMAATKQFQQELDRPDATVASVTQALVKKHVAAKAFEQELGMQWPALFYIKFKFDNRSWQRK